MNKTVIAIDSFKGSLTSIEAGKAAAEGIRRVRKTVPAGRRRPAGAGYGTAAGNHQ